MSTYAFLGFSIVPPFLLAVLLSGCASWCRKDTIHAKIPPVQYPDAANCACTLEYRSNLCVTVNGSDSVPAGLSFVRQHENGRRDSLNSISTILNPSGPQCFGEARGVQRILLRKNGALVDSTGWFEIQTVDCCHGAAKTVDFKR